jgi:hypothetical protein
MGVERHERRYRPAPLRDDRNVPGFCGLDKFRQLIAGLLDAFSL